jgi:hypothetical protein
MNLKPLSDTNCCATCGSANLTLAVDRTEYTPVLFENGAWSLDDQASNTEIINGDPDPSVRLFCPECGEYHFVPDALTDNLH